jgi:hypothetical protein
VSDLGLAPAVVVYDVNVLVTTAASGNSPFRSWPSPPPVSGNPAADCVGVIADAAEFALWLSPHILANVDRVLGELFKWDPEVISAYLGTLVAAALSPWRGTPIIEPAAFAAKVDAMRRHARRRLGQNRPGIEVEGDSGGGSGVAG